MIVRIFALHTIIIINTEIIISHCLELGHEEMVCAAWFSLFYMHLYMSNHYEFSLAAEFRSRNVTEKQVKTDISCKHAHFH